jgi:hypothetical protein
MGHLRKLSRSAHPEVWAELTRFRRLRRATQRMAAFGGFERLRVSSLMKKLQASGVFVPGMDGAPKQTQATHAADPSTGQSFIQKGKGLLKRVSDALKGGNR